MLTAKQLSRRAGWLIVAGAVIAVLTVRCGQTPESQQYPPDGGGGGIPIKINGNVPLTVDLPNPDTLSALQNRPFFDNFSWQSFIALCWPVDGDRRGVPLNPNDQNTFLTMTNTTPVVWTSYKNQFDLFAQGNERPSPWDSWSDPVGACPDGTSPRHVFGSAKGATLVGDVDESFSVPLIDQNKNYTLFEMRYNQAQYDFIRGNDSDPSSWLYLKKNLVKYQMAHNDQVQMPSSSAPATPGAILVKAAWRVMTASDDLSRYYIIDEPVFDPVTGQCVTQKMGLVGLHIVQKISGFSQWIWSSFEQVDNVPGSPSGQAPYSYNNGTRMPPTPRGYANKPDSTGINADKPSRVPVQVVRLNPVPTTPVHNSTVDINMAYQRAVSATWLKHYQLVITQWPTDDASFKLPLNGGIYPKDCGVPFPADSAANTTMETYFQSLLDGAAFNGNSCMSCHYTAAQTDFSWSLQLRSH